MFPPQNQQQAMQMPAPVGGPVPPAPMGGASGFQPQGPTQIPQQPAVPQGAQPMSPQQQQIMQAMQQALAPEELQIVKQSLTPEMMAIVIKLFGPQVSMLLDPLVMLANSSSMMDAGDGIGGVDIEQMGGAPGVPQHGLDDDSAPPEYAPQGSVSSPFRGVKATY